MPNVLGGGKYKKTKTKRKANRNKEITIDPNDGIHFYGIINKNLGGDRPRFMIQLHDGTTTQAISPGRLKKKIWINIGDYVVVYKENTSCEIVCKINNDYQKKIATKYLDKYVQEEDIPEITFGNKKNNELGIEVNYSSSDESDNKEKIEKESSESTESDGSSISTDEPDIDTL